MTIWMCWLGLALAQETPEPTLAMPAEPEEASEPAAEPAAEEAPDQTAVFRAPGVEERWKVRSTEHGYVVLDERDREVEIRRFASTMGDENLRRQATELARKRAAAGTWMTVSGAIATVAGVPLFHLTSRGYTAPGWVVLSGATALGGAALFTGGIVQLSNKRIRRPYGWYSEREARQLVARYNGDLAPTSSPMPEAAPGEVLTEGAPAPRLIGRPWGLERDRRGAFVRDDSGDRVAIEELALALGDVGALERLQTRKKERRQTGFGVAGASAGLFVLGLAGQPLWEDLDAPALGTAFAVTGAAGAVGGLVWAFTPPGQHAAHYFSEDQLQRAVEEHNQELGVASAWRRRSGPTLQLTFGPTSIGIAGQF